MSILNIVLIEPEIPPNTGNVARLCAGTRCALHLVKPLGFSVDDRQLKRAGLDYWHLLDLHYHENWHQFFQAHQDALDKQRMFFLSTKGGSHYHQVQYRPGDFLVFGKETKGLPEEMLQGNGEQVVRIPLIPDARSLNLSNAVAVVVFEALRQLNFPQMV